MRNSAIDVRQLIQTLPSLAEALPSEVQFSDSPGNGPHTAAPCRHPR